MKKQIFKGSGVAIVTPFTKDNEHVDFEKLGELIEFQIANDTQAIIICGTTGESPTLSFDEKKAAIKYTVDKVNGRVPVVAGTGGNNTKQVIELSQYSESVGADGLLVVTPFYNKTTQQGLVRHYTAIANSVNLPIILYNVPSRTGLNISANTCFELSKVDNIVAVKEASSDIAQIAEIAAKCGDDLYIYSGNDDQIVPILSLGGIGVISVIANILPKETNDICQSYFDGNVEYSKKLQLKYIDLVKSLFIEVNPMPVKQALNDLGYNVGICRMPLTTMEEKNVETLRNSLQKLNML